MKRHPDWPTCFTCGGKGRESTGETCMGCGGSGRDPECCERCEDEGIGFDEDGHFLCPDCIFEAQMKAQERELEGDG